MSVILLAAPTMPIAENPTPLIIHAVNILGNSRRVCIPCTDNMLSKTKLKTPFRAHAPSLCNKTRDMLSISQKVIIVIPA